MKRFTIVLGGQFGVGKSSLFRYVQLHTSSGAASNDDITECKCVYETSVDGESYEVTLWDTAGMERSATMTSNYFRFCNAIVLVYRLGGLDSQNSLHALQDEWVELAKSYNKQPHGMLVSLWGNTTVGADQESQRLAQSTAKELQHQCNIPASLHCTVNARTGEGVLEALDTVITAVAQKYKQSQLSDKGKKHSKTITVDKNHSKNQASCKC